MSTHPPQFEFSAKTHGELREAALALMQWDAPRALVHPSTSTRPDPEEARRAELVAMLDRQLSELIRLRDAHRVTGGEAGDQNLAQLDQQVGQLAALKERVQSASSIAALSQLRAQVNETVQAASTTARGAETAVMAAGAGGVAAAEARFAQRMNAIDRETAPLIAQSHKLADEADLRARMLGLDTSKYTNQHKHLLQSAQKKRDKGDHIGALEDETLDAHNTANHWGAIADAETDPNKKAEAEAKAAEARRKAAELEEQLRKAREAEAEKDAARSGKTFANDAEKSAWIKAQADQSMAAFADKKAKLIDETGSRPTLQPEQKTARAKAAEEHAGQSSIIGHADETVKTQSASLKKVEVCKDADQNREKIEDKNRREEVDGDLLAATSSLATLSTTAKDQAKQAGATLVAQAGSGKAEEQSELEKPNVPTRTADAGKSGNAHAKG